MREGRFLNDAPRVLDEARRAGHRVEVLFLDSSRRRAHPPLLRDAPPPPALRRRGGVAEGIARERALLKDLREQAQHLLDTSTLTVHELKRQVMARFGAARPPAGWR